MKAIFFIFFTLIFPCLSYSQDSPNPLIKVEYIKEFTVKIDGGTTFYTYDTAKLDTINYSNYILVVTDKNVALMKFADKD